MLPSTRGGFQRRSAGGGIWDTHFLGNGEGNSTITEELELEAVVNEIQVCCLLLLLLLVDIIFTRIFGCF